MVGLMPAASIGETAWETALCVILALQLLAHFQSLYLECHVTETSSRQRTLSGLV